MNVRLKFNGDEYVDFAAEQCNVSDWPSALRNPDFVLEVKGLADDSAHTLYVPVRQIVAVETYPATEAAPAE
jgi:hypothetical protein